MKSYYKFTIMLVLTIVIAGCNSDQQQSTPLPSFTGNLSNGEAAVTKQPVIMATFNDTERKEIERYLRKTINNIAEEKTVLNKKDRITDIKFDGKNITAELMADNSLGMEEMVVLNKSSQIFKTVFHERTDLESLTLQWRRLFLDAKGNETIEPLIDIMLSAKNEKTFHWDKMVFTRLPEAVDSYLAH